MFRYISNRRRAKRFSRQISSVAHETTQINKLTSLVGDVSFSGFLGINGEIKGNIIATSKKKSIVVVFGDAKVDGKIKSHTVVVFGNVLGDIEAVDLTIEDGSKIKVAVVQVALLKQSLILNTVQVTSDEIEIDHPNNPE